MDKRTLVTGASGVVGQALVDLLRHQGEDVIAIRGRRDCDLEDSVATRKFFEDVRPHQVYHLAGAVFGVGGNIAFPGDAFRRNVLMNTNVVDATRLIEAQKIVAMGSAAMYSDEAALPLNEQEALAGEPHGSEYSYAYSKRALLVQLISYKKQYGLDYAFAIATNMYGPHDRFDAEFGHVVPSLLIKFTRAQLAGEAVQIWGDGSPTRDFLFAKDAARGLVLMMKAGDGSYNLASGQSVQIKELVAEIARLFPGVHYSWDPSKPLGQLRRSYDVHALNALGFRPAYDLRNGLVETVDWLRSNLGDLRSYAPYP